MYIRKDTTSFIWLIIIKSFIFYLIDYIRKDTIAAD